MAFCQFHFVLANNIYGGLSGSLQENQFLGADVISFFGHSENYFTLKITQHLPDFKQEGGEEAFELNSLA